MSEGVKPAQESDSERAKWDTIFAAPDPWNYTSPYERQKYDRTLSLFPDGDIEDALELGCAEGHFTATMAGRVKRLLAADISAVAIERARARCGDVTNVRFAWCDISRELPAGEFDLIVCSEILYYMKDRYALQDVARRIGRLLKPGGSLVMAHANVVSDDPAVTGFDFTEYGAKFIGETFARSPAFEFACEVRTPLYAVQKFVRARGATARKWGERGIAPFERIERDADFEHPSLKVGGCVVVDAEARHCYRTGAIPILMYHRIADDGPSDLAPYRVTPAMFDRQMRLLQRHGYQTVSVDAASGSYGASRAGPLPGRLIALTFDDGYRDFLETAWPILRRYGFSATVYLPTDHVGGRAEWDAPHGAPAPLVTWDEVKALSAEGVQFGAHGASHRRLTRLDADSRSSELSRCRQKIAEATGRSITSFCYPYGDHNADARQAVASAGFEHAVITALNDGSDQFALPRIEVEGSGSLEDFYAALPAPEFAPESDRLNYRRLHALKDRRLYDV